MSDKTKHVKAPAAQLGQDMWAMLSTSFHEVAAENGLTTSDKRLALWAGFVASVAGAMCADIGAAATQALLDGTKVACQEVMRSNIRSI